MFFFFKQKTAYELRISDWSSDVCSSDLAVVADRDRREPAQLARRQRAVGDGDPQHVGVQLQVHAVGQAQRLELVFGQLAVDPAGDLRAELRDALGHEGAESGRASCRERGCQYVWISVGGVRFKKTHNRTKKTL